jgi:hypothetical protein
MNLENVGYKIWDFAPIRLEQPTWYSVMEPVNIRLIQSISNEREHEDELREC